MGAGQSTPDVPEIPANIQAPPLAVVDSVIQGDVGALTSTAGGGANPDVLNTSVLERIAQAANDLKGNGKRPACLSPRQRPRSPAPLLPFHLGTVS